MAIIAKSKGNSVPVSEGVHTGVCIWVIDLGEQYNKMFDNTSRKVMLTWEIPDETIVVEGEEKPRVISKEYTLSLGEKAVLRQHLEAWRGKKFTEDERRGFDLANILGKSCQLQVLHNDKGYAQIGSVMALPKGMAQLEPEGDTIYFDLENPGCVAVMDKLPGWIQDKIKASSTYQNLVGANVDSDGYQEIDDDDKDLPF